MRFLRTLLTVLLALSFSLQAAGGMARGKCDHTSRTSHQGAAGHIALASADDPHKGHHMAGHVMSGDGTDKPSTEKGSACNCDCSCQVGHCASHGTISVAKSSQFVLTGLGDDVRLPLIVVNLTAAHGSGLLRPPSIA